MDMEINLTQFILAEGRGLRQISTVNIPYKPEYKVAPNIRRPPIFPMRKSEKKVFLAKLNISFRSKGCE
jgi:hypothetical protein